MILKTSTDHIGDILEIYNNLTNRGRSFEQHLWEWERSPYQNFSYVILDKEKRVLGHHGILGIKLYFSGEILNVGKTENTVVKPGYGSLYFKNEKEMFLDYAKKNDLLISTTVNGVTMKIRSKLGYKEFSKYTIKFKLVSFNSLKRYFKNDLIKKIIYYFSFIFDFIITYKKINADFTSQDIELVDENNLITHVQLYDKIKNSLGISQFRELTYLKYRLIDNPYKKSYIIRILDKKSNDTIGSVIFYISKNTAYIEDILFESEEVFENTIKAMFNYLKASKLAAMIFIKLLDNSVLNNLHWKGFFNLEQEKDCFMINELGNTLNFNNKKFYFTPLFNEGII